MNCVCCLNGRLLHNRIGKLRVCLCIYGGQYVPFSPSGKVIDIVLRNGWREDQEEESDQRSGQPKYKKRLCRNEL